MSASSGRRSSALGLSPREQLSLYAALREYLGVELGAENTLDQRLRRRIEALEPSVSRRRHLRPPSSTFLARVFRLAATGTLKALLVGGQELVERRLCLASALAHL